MLDSGAALNEAVMTGQKSVFDTFLTPAIVLGLHSQLKLVAALDELF